MTRSRTWLLACTGALLTACGSVNGPDDPGEPIAVVTATLIDAPEGLGETGPLRAALVWTNGLGFSNPHGPGNACTSTAEDLAVRYAECEAQLRQNVQITTSDVEVEMEFPLTVTLAMFDLPTPVLQHIDDPNTRIVNDVDGTDTHLVGDFYSLPEAEVVLYEDGNGNEQLDLLPIGQPGPGPDRVVALSSGMDTNGDAVRTAVVYKAGALPWWISAYGPLVDPPWDDPDHVQLPNGVYAYSMSYGPENEITQRRMLGRHALVGPGTPFGEDAGDAQAEPIADATIRLFAVTPERPSWLSRGCERLLTLGGLVAPGLPPPAGADVQCGSNALAFASHPDDYCGQSDIVMNTTGAELPAWWPCDANGLKAGTPYRASTQRLDGDPTWWGSLSALGFGTAIHGGLDWHCREGVVYHFDRLPNFRMPTVAPAPGSQVMCHGADALSFIPPRADGCLFKYRADLASDPTWPGATPAMGAWDQRANRPAWWPCDASGQLRSDSGMSAPQTPATADCEGIEEYISTSIAPPEGSAIQCESHTQLTYVPPWSDACDPKGKLATSFMTATSSVSGSTPAWWPCDEDGNFIPTPHFVEQP